MSYGFLRHGDGLAGLVRSETERAAHGVEVLPREGAEGHGAVVHRLRWCAPPPLPLSSARRRGLGS